MLNDFALFLKNEYGAFAEAEKYYRKALKINPTNSIYLNNLAVLLSVQKEYQEEAVFYFKQSLDQNPNDANTIANLANLLFNYKGAIKQSESLFTKAININPDDPAIRTNYAALLITQNAWPEANEHLHLGWRSISSNHNRISARILFLKAALESLHGNDYDFYIGQIKSLIMMGISHAPWCMSVFIDYLNRKLSFTEFKYFQLLIDAILKWEKLSDLLDYKRWQKQSTIGLELLWPNQ